MAHKTQAGIGGYASELKVELLPGDILVGIHVECGMSVDERGADGLDVLAVEEGGRWYGNGLVAAGEHSPTVAGPFGDVEWFSFLEKLQHGQIVDVAGVAVGKLESGGG